jgi:hypothetical protein
MIEAPEEPVVSPQTEPEPAGPVLVEPEEIMALTNEDISRLKESFVEVLETMQARLDGLEKRSVTAAPATQGLEDVRKQVTELEARVQSPDPRLTELAEKAETLVELCELHPELCAHLKPPPPAEPARPAKAPAQPKDAHDAILEAISQAGIETLGRAPTWGDLMDLCPGGNCGTGVVEAIGKRPLLLKELVAQEGVADVLIEALKASGKLMVEPEPPPAPAPEVVTSERKVGWFGRIPEPRG